MAHPIDGSFYARDPVLVARDLIGLEIVRTINNEVLRSMIVETEAYRTHDDPACHGYQNISPRTQALYGPPGHAYVYFVYGNHYCFNAVAHEQGYGGGVLIRAVRPLAGIETMERNRGICGKNLTNGPGKVAQALAITKELYGIDLTKEGPLYIVQGPSTIARETIVATPRIGITRARDYPWRFYLP